MRRPSPLRIIKVMGEAYYPILLSGRPLRATVKAALRTRKARRIRSGWTLVKSMDPLWTILSYSVLSLHQEVA